MTAVVKILQEFLKTGSNINGKDKNGQTLLHHAIIEDRIDIVQHLISKKADLNVLNNMMVSPICLAVAKSNAGIATTLINGGAKLSFDKDAKITIPAGLMPAPSPVSTSTTSSSASEIKGFDYGHCVIFMEGPNSINNQFPGISIRSAAISIANIQMIDLIISKTGGYSKKLDASDPFESNLLHDAVYFDARFNLASRLAPSSFWGWGPPSPTDPSDSKNNVAVINHLVAKGVDINALGIIKTSSIEVPLSPLYIAINWGNFDQADALLAKGASIKLEIDETNGVPDFVRGLDNYTNEVNDQILYLVLNNADFDLYSVNNSDDLLAIAIAGEEQSSDPWSRPDSWVIEGDNQQLVGNILENFKTHGNLEDILSKDYSGKMATEAGNSFLHFAAQECAINSVKLILQYADYIEPFNSLSPSAPTPPIFSHVLNNQQNLDSKTAKDLATDNNCGQEVIDLL